MENNIEQEIKCLFDNSIYEIGFASLSGLLDKKWSVYEYGISIVRKLDDKIIDGIINGPTMEYYNLYNDINSELNSKTQDIVNLLKGYNIKTFAVKSTVSDKELDDNYRKTLRYFFSHKMVATRAGLGWIGKTDLLISKRFGPRIRLASVLISSKLFDPGNPIEESYCGSCNLCVLKCPAEAASGKLWNSSMDRDEFYNPFKCRNFARRISARNIDKEESLCGICVAICPVGKDS